MVKRQKFYTKKKRRGKGFKENGTKAGKINASAVYETCTEQLSPFGGLLPLIKFLDIEYNSCEYQPTGWGVACMSANLFFRRGIVEGLLKKNEHRTSNVQHRILHRRTSVEWEKMKKQK